MQVAVGDCRDLRVFQRNSTDGFERDVGLDGFADDFVVGICDVHD